MTEDLKPAQPRARGSTRARGSMRQMRPQPRRAGIDRTRQLNLKPDATPTTSGIARVSIEAKADAEVPARAGIDPPSRDE